MTRAARRLAFALLVVAVAAVPATRGNTAPASWECDGGAGVGARTPILLVHGFNSSARTWSNASQQYLATSAARSTCIATFDYGPYSTDWVTDRHIAPELAQTIVRLAKASKSSGGSGKLIVVAHSMGGLALRCAATEACSRVAGVTDDLAGVVTFDAPNLGSFLKAGVLGPVASILGPVLSAQCNTAIDGLPNLVGLCSEVRALGTSAATRAFTPGSSELAQLPELPKSVPVFAVAGSVKVVTSFFGHERGDVGDGGDLVVDETSALAEANRIGGIGGTLVVDCGTLDMTAPWLSTTTCWHTGETNDPSFLAAALATIGKIERGEGTGPATSLPQSVWSSVGGTQINSADSSGAFEAAYNGTFWGGLYATAPSSIGCDYRFDGMAQLLTPASSASGSPGYGFGARSAIDSGGTPHSQAVQYDPGVGGFRDTLYPEHSEDGAVTHATLDNGWHEIAMEVVGDRYQASVDGRVIFTGTTPLACGGLYIRIWRASIELRNLSVTPITALSGTPG